MPRTANKRRYAQHRALVVALAQRAQNDRRRIIEAVACCLAERRRVPRRWIVALDDAELTEALHLAITLASRRKWQIRTAVATWLSDLEAVWRRVLHIVSGSWPSSDRS